MILSLTLLFWDLASYVKKLETGKTIYESSNAVQLLSILLFLTSLYFAIKLDFKITK